MMLNGAKALIKALELEGVSQIFGYPGGAILPVYDALCDSPIEHILTRSEQGAAHAASGFARVSGKVGVCMATSGPGATNLVTGIATAYMDSIPIVAVTGQVPTGVIGTDAFQEVDITGATAPFTKHNYLVRDARQIPRIVKEAFYIASSGRPGPVLIDLPKDMAEAEVEFDYPETVDLKGYKPNIKGHPLQIERSAKAIDDAQRPVIIAGGGINMAEAEVELIALAEKASIPVVTTLMGIGAMPADHPLYLGMLGMHGLPEANKAITQSDLIIAAGARFSDRSVGNSASFAPKANIIHIDIDPAEIGKNMHSHTPIVGDVKQILGEIARNVKAAEGPCWCKDLREERERREAKLDSSEGAEFGPVKVLRMLSEKTRGEAIITTEVGSHQMWAAQNYGFKHPRHFISSGGLGTMGYGLPAAIGAQMSQRDKEVINICGDGSFQMNLPEMATAVENGLPIKIILFNNSGLGLVRQLQEFYCKKRYNQVHFKFVPDFVSIARGYSIKSRRVTSMEEIPQAIEELLSEKGAFLLECMVDIDENVYPMVLSGTGIDEMIGG